MTASATQNASPTTIGMIIEGKKVAEGTLSSLLAQENAEDLEDAFFKVYKRVKGEDKIS